VQVIRNQTGSALIGVIAIVLIVSLMGAAFFSITSVDTQEREIQSAWVKALALTQGAVESTFKYQKNNPNEHNMKQVCDGTLLPEGCEYCPFEACGGLASNKNEPCCRYDSSTQQTTICIRCSVQINSKGDKVGTQITAIIPPLQ
jgi:hypothetical protein